MKILLFNLFIIFFLDISQATCPSNGPWQEGVLPNKAKALGISNIVCIKVIREPKLGFEAADDHCKKLVKGGELMEVKNLAQFSDFRQNYIFPFIQIRMNGRGTNNPNTTWETRQGIEVSKASFNEQGFKYPSRKTPKQTLLYYFGSPKRELRIKNWGWFNRGFSFACQVNSTVTTTAPTTIVSTTTVISSTTSPITTTIFTTTSPITTTIFTTTSPITTTIYTTTSPITTTIFTTTSPITTTIFTSTTATTSPITTTIFTSTTAAILPSLNLLVLGSTGTQIIPVGPTPKNCSTIPNFPDMNFDGSLAVVNNEIIACINSGQSCRILNGTTKQWQTITSALNKPSNFNSRSSNVVLQNGNWFITGGEESFSPAPGVNRFRGITKTSIYNGTSKLWIVGPDMNVRRRKHCSVQVGSKTFLLGGLNLDGTAYQSVSYYDWNNVSQGWIVTNNVLPLGYVGCQAFFFNGSIHVTGSNPGTPDSRVKTYKIDPDSLTQTEGVDLPAIRSFGSIAISGNDIFLVGGTTESNPNAGTTFQKDIYYYNSTSGNFETNYSGTSTPQLISAANYPSAIGIPSNICT